MRIALDCRWIPRKMFGIGSYTRDIITQLARIDSQNEYVLLFNDAEVRDRTVRDTGSADSANFSTADLPYGVFSPKSQLLLPGVLRKNGIDVFHSPNYMIPFAAFPRRRKGGIACVVTIHDVIPMIFRHHAPQSRKSRMFPLYRLVMKEAAARADIIVTDSRCSAADIVKHLDMAGASADKVVAVYLGVADRYRHARDAAVDPDPPSGAPRATYLDCSEGAKNILYAGRMDPYKNLDTLVRAFHTARQQATFPVSLTIVGGIDPRYPEVPALVKEFGLDESVKWTGYVPDADLVFLYRNCDVLVHPSRYEGFGLTVAQALASGLPVISSNAGPLPEVVGEAGILLDPDDVSGFTAKIVEVLSTPSLARELSDKGVERAARFNWENTAREILDLYRSLGP